MKVGLVGYAGSGKSTVFQWLTGVAPDPAKVQQGQVGTAKVLDDRLGRIAEKYKPKKLTVRRGRSSSTRPGLMADDRKDNPRRLGILREANGVVVVLDGFTRTDFADQLRKFREELLFADLEIVVEPHPEARGGAEEGEAGEGARGGRGGTGAAEAGRGRVRGRHAGVGPGAHRRRGEGAPQLPAADAQAGDRCSSTAATPGSTTRCRRTCSRWPRRRCRRR